MAKNTQSTKASSKSAKTQEKVLSKRIDLAKRGALGKDIKTPKFLRAIGSYFKGSYQELREVRWPTRKATWSLTLAVILFTAFFVALILLLDLGLEKLFREVIL